jgi:hypothetical protein
VLSGNVLLDKPGNLLREGSARSDDLDGSSRSASRASFARLAPHVSHHASQSSSLQLFYNPYWSIAASLASFKMTLKFGSSSI